MGPLEFVPLVVVHGMINFDEDCRSNYEWKSINWNQVLFNLWTRGQIVSNYKCQMNRKHQIKYNSKSNTQSFFLSAKSFSIILLYFVRDIIVHVFIVIVPHYIFKSTFMLSMNYKKQSYPFKYLIKKYCRHTYVIKQFNQIDNE